MFDSKKAMELQNIRCVENFKKLTIPQMLERGKLIELLESAESAVYWSGSDKGFIEKIADHLIANGVTIPVRCKDCKWYCIAPIDNVPYCCHESGYCGEYMGGLFFCACGERKDNG